MTTPLDELSGAVNGSWHRFLDVYEPLRPDLYRYCRYLTRSPWDAEDLAQDALARAFVTLGGMGAGPPNPRAWLFRVASNLWIDQTRRARPIPATGSEPAVFPEPRAAREAAGTLLVRLSPQERAAVVLKDVFELTLEEIAEILATTTGAVKAALSGGRGKLAAPDAEDRPGREPPPAVLDAFCAAFNARDLDALAALLLDTSVVEVVGCSTEYGGRGRILGGMLFGSKRLADFTWLGIDLGLRTGVHPSPPRGEVRAHRGELLLLSWYAHDDGEAVRAVSRIEPDGDRVARLRNYFYTPDLLAEICGELEVPFRSNGYRYWIPTESTR
jgi:RNA polymerase sigma-70 factor (ECF subfamily)